MSELDIDTIERHWTNHHLSGGCANIDTVDVFALIAEVRRLRHRLASVAPTPPNVMEAIQNIRELGPDRVTYRRGSAVDATFALLAKVMELPRWISASERLPERSVDVLAFVASGFNDRKMVVVRHGDVGLDLYEWTEMCQLDTLDDVTHWMPLPEPPRETK